MGKRFWSIVIPLFMFSLSFFSCQSTVPHLPVFKQQDIVPSPVLPQNHFDQYLSHRQLGPIIPGLFQAAVPQGLAYLPKEEMFLTSNYMLDGRTAALVLISVKEGLHKGKLEKVIRLYNHDGSRHTGHVGGIAVSTKSLWVASDSHMYRLDLSKVLNARNEATLRLPPPLTTEVRCSAATAYKDTLYIAEFRRGEGSYGTPRTHTFTTSGNSRNHALMAGFKLNSTSGKIPADQIKSGTAYPHFFISIPDQVQGIAFLSGHIVLSQSYGRINNSRLSIYRSPLKEPAPDTFTLSDSTTVPVRHLGPDRKTKSITAPPMTEAIASVDNSHLAILFESASDKYRRSARYPQSRIHLLSIDILKPLE